MLDARTFTAQCLLAALVLSPATAFPAGDMLAANGDDAVVEAKLCPVGEDKALSHTLLESFCSRIDRPDLWFPVGERLTYNIRWGPFAVGTAVVTSEWVEKNGREFVAIRVITRSTPFFDRIYRVDDFLESIVEPDAFVPVRFTKHLQEGRNHLHQITTFDHASGTAVWHNVLTGDKKDLTIEQDTRCLLSFMFYMRSYNFEPDMEYRFRLMADDNIHDLDVISRSYENVSLSGYGRVRGLLLEPHAPFHGLFVRVGGIQLWISDDERVLCMRARAGIVVGSISVSLAAVDGVGEDFWSGGGER